MLTLGLRFTLRSLTPVKTPPGHTPVLSSLLTHQQRSHINRSIRPSLSLLHLSIAEAGYSRGRTSYHFNFPSSSSIILAG